MVSVMEFEPLTPELEEFLRRFSARARALHNLIKASKSCNQQDVDSANSEYKSQHSLCQKALSRFPSPTLQSIDLLLRKHGFVIHSGNAPFKDGWYVLKLTENNGTRNFAGVSCRWFIGTSENPLALEPFANEEGEFSYHFFQKPGEFFANQASIRRNFSRISLEKLDCINLDVLGNLSDQMHLRFLADKYDECRCKANPKKALVDLCSQEVMELKLFYEYPFLQASAEVEDYYKALASQLTNYFSFFTLSTYTSPYSPHECREAGNSLLKKLKGRPKDFLLKAHSEEVKKTLQQLV